MSITREYIEEFGSLELLARQIVDGFITGLHKSPFHGFSVEFAEHRQYNTGEDTRNIDWKLYGRTDRLYVKRYEEETNLRCRILMDVSASMYYPHRVPGKQYTKFEFSAYCAAALMELFKKQRDAFGLSLFSDELFFESEVRSTGNHQRFLDQELEKWLHAGKPQKGQKTALYAYLHEAAESMPKRSLLVLFSDLFDQSPNTDEFRDALQHLRHNQHEVIVFHVLDRHTELEFGVDNRYLRMIDMETGEEMKLHPSEVKQAYREQALSFEKDMALICGQLGVDFIQADIAGGFQPILLSYLRRRKKMR